MKHRRMVGLVLVVALVAMAFPTPGEARVFGDLGDVSSGPGMLERVAQIMAHAQSLLTELSEQILQFVTSEGASITPSG